MSQVLDDAEFPRMTYGRRAYPRSMFPENRSPWHDMFTRDKLKEIGSIIGLKETARLDALGWNLAQVAGNYLALADDTALELPAKERARWIEENMLRPAIALREALSDQNERFLSLWPQEDIELCAGEHRSRVDEIIRWGKERREWHLYRDKPRIKPSTDFRHSLVFNLILIYERYASHPRLGLTTYRKKIVRGKISLTKERDYGFKGSASRGELADFVQATAEPILGLKAELTDEMRVALRKIKKVRSS